MQFLSFVDYLRGWVGAVGLITIINAVQAASSPEMLFRNVYSLLQPQSSPLVARLFALTSIQSGIVRFVFCLRPDDHLIRFLTITSFIISILHLCSELLIFHTASWTFGVLSNLFVSVVALLMFIVEMVISTFRSYMNRHNTTDTKEMEEMTIRQLQNERRRYLKSKGT